MKLWNVLEWDWTINRDDALGEGVECEGGSGSSDVRGEVEVANEEEFELEPDDED